jgi:hypothetical protein
MNIIDQLAEMTKMNYQEALQDGYSPLEIIKELLKRYMAISNPLRELDIKKSPSSKVPIPIDTLTEQSSPSSPKTSDSSLIKIAEQILALSKENNNLVLKPIEHTEKPPTKGKVIRKFGGSEIFNN